MNRKYANYLLKKTKNDYNRMASKFSSTRKFLSPDILALKKYAKGKVLDLGCGNGRLFELFTDEKINYTGADNSENLLKIAQKNYPTAKFILLKDSITLPFADNSFDTIYSLAVFHHIPSAQLRQQYLAEIERALKSGGTLILTAWNLAEKPELKRRLAVNNFLSFFKLTPLDRNDIFYDFSEGEKLIARRYIHCFTQKELTDLIAANGFEVIENGIIRRGKRGRFSNIQLIAKLDN